MTALVRKRGRGLGAGAGRATGTVFSGIAQPGGVSLLGQRFVAALLGAAVVWRLVNGVGALVRWLWLGERVGNLAMLLFLLSVVVVPVFGAIGGDAAVRNGVWSTTARAHRRRVETLLGVVLLPLLGNLSLRGLLSVTDLLLLLQGAVTLVLVGTVLFVERRYGPFSGQNE